MGPDRTSEGMAPLVHIGPAHGIGRFRTGNPNLCGLALSVVRSGDFPQRDKEKRLPRARERACAPSAPFDFRLRTHSDGREKGGKKGEPRGVEGSRTFEILLRTFWNILEHSRSRDLR